MKMCRQIGNSKIRGTWVVRVGYMNVCRQIGNS